MFIETDGRKVFDVLAELNELLEIYGAQPDEYGVWCGGDIVTWPEGRWIACYAVRGGSEGWYVHIDVITQDRERLPIGLAKCWSKELAWKVATKAAELLDA
jgi:hypothetical protein